MSLKFLSVPIAAMFVPVLLHGQQSVCDLFQDLKAADGRQLTVTGELIISKDLAALGAADCDYRYIFQQQIWPTAMHLRPSTTVPAEQVQQFREAAAKADRLRSAGKFVSSSAVFSGRIQVVTVEGFPAELTFDSIEDLKVEALPDPSELPVIPICSLFQNLAAWKGKRIAVRAESTSTSEGSWIVGRCKGSFYTNGYRWPVVLDYAGPAYSSSHTASLSDPKWPSEPPKGQEFLRGRYNVIRTATYVGRLRMRSEYTAVCRESGDYLTNGFGHLNGAAAELIVEAVRDIKLTRPAEGSGYRDEQAPCQPANLAVLCASATTLARAASLGCVDRARELLSQGGIDSKDGYESAALGAAIRRGDETLVKMLLKGGAPVNPATFRLWPPLAEAAHNGQIHVMTMLLGAGANVDAPDNHGTSYLPSFGCFDARVARVLLEAGANPNSRDDGGETALMQASGYGYEDIVKLLIDYHADVNLKDSKGRSALMHAAAGQYVDAIPVLLAHGADLHDRNRQGNTALEIARKSKNQVAVEILSAATNGAR